MSGAFRWCATPPEPRVPVTVDGTVMSLPANRSLLAGLLTVTDAAGFFCAIGQCERCVVRINGMERVACLTQPQAGDVVETPALWRRR